MPTDSDAAYVNEWTQIYDARYSLFKASGSENLACWDSSYTTKPMPKAVMSDWIENTCNKIKNLPPFKTKKPRVLEIGCGTGLIYFPIASSCSFFVGVDPSPAVIQNIEDDARQRGLTERDCKFYTGAGHETADLLAGLAEETLFDVVILNSVVQYFPNLQHLEDILLRTREYTAKDGVIFVGDVLDRQFRDVLHTTVAIARSVIQHPAHATVTATEIIESRNEKWTEDNELIIHPRYFVSLMERGLFHSAVCELKAGSLQSEMNSFRYDAVLTFEEKLAMMELPAITQVMLHPALSEEELFSTIKRHEVVLVTNILNSRVVDDLLVSVEVHKQNRHADTICQINDDLKSHPLRQYQWNMQQFQNVISSASAVHAVYFQPMTSQSEDPKQLSLSSAMCSALLISKPCLEERVPALARQIYGQYFGARFTRKPENTTPSHNLLGGTSPMDLALVEETICHYGECREARVLRLPVALDSNDFTLVAFVSLEGTALGTTDSAPLTIPLIPPHIAFSKIKEIRSAVRPRLAREEFPELWMPVTSIRQIAIDPNTSDPAIEDIDESLTKLYFDLGAAYTFRSFLAAAAASV
ncbi:hypothetical protein DFS34DRAFT_620508 [Phlyctochytrium arcticum]|nr:hypothetical protein DFS34DRAFT_620508 [Phlyctochytrium arcticum]